MKCPTCSAVNAEGDRFCVRCGGTLSRQCARCGRDNAAGAVFCGGCGERLVTGAPAPEPQVRGEARGEAGRRQLTVLFADLAGSTALATSLDPEDLRRVMTAYQSTATQVIERFEGHVAKFMGDGVLAYFGYPEAHEDNPERAIRAGLELVDAVAGLKPHGGVELAVRVGIATGLVVVGDLLGEGAAKELAVLGETPNLAARLQDLGEPGWVVIDPATARLVGGLFDQIALGAKPLKGFDTPIDATRVLGPSAVDRFDARHAAALTPLVGREQELALLMQRFEEARRGEAQVVVLAGEPGIGKSRLVRALLEQLPPEHRLVQFQALPYYRHSVLQPVIEELERAAGIAPGDAAEIKLDKLSSHLGSLGLDDPAPMACLAELLAIPLVARSAGIGRTSRREKARIVDALLERLAALASPGPLVIVFEDVQWADPSSMEVLERILDESERLPVLLVLTRRPEVPAPETGAANVTALTLGRLGRRHALAMVEGLFEAPPPADVVEQILAKADGIPLYLEELTRSVQESRLPTDLDDDRGRSPNLDRLAVPATLHDSLTARLDRLGKVREIAEIASVIGRDFSYELLVATSPWPEAELRSGLAQLAEGGLILARGRPPWATYRFKHALVQEAAYTALLRERREKLHERVARVLAAEFPHVMETHPELIAHHLALARQEEEAVEFWREAAELAIGRSAAKEAVAHLSHALELLAGFPDSELRDRTELGLQIMLGGALVAARSFADPDTGRAYARAWELSRRLGDEVREFPALFGRWIFHAARAELSQALGVADAMLRLARQRQDAALSLIAHRALANTRFFTGDLYAARAHAERALARYHPDRHGALAALYIADPFVLCAFFLAHSLLRLGQPEAARAHAEQALARAHELDHVVTLAHALHHDCLFWQLHRDPDAVEWRAERLIALAVEHGLPFWQALAEIFRGWAWGERGRLEAGIAEMEKGLADYRTTSGLLYLPYSLTLLADLCRQSGAIERADEALAEAEGLFETTRMRGFEAHLHRVKGEVELARPAPDLAAAEASFEQAMTIARHQRAKLSELRAATALARLRAHRGDAHAARELLQPLYESFSEGFDLPDLTEARALLDRLDLRP